MFSMIPYFNTGSVRVRDNRRDNSLSPFADNFFRAFFDGDWATGQMRVDVQDKGDHYLLEADLPGMQRENVHVDVDEGVLTIRAESGESKEEKGKENGYLCRERRYASMSRSFTLNGIKENEIGAQFQDGVLRLTLPKDVEAPVETKRVIEIK